MPGRAGRPIGILQLDSRSRRTRFGPDDLDLLAAAAIPIGMAIENYRLFTARAEAAAAREIQLALLPRHRPDLAGYAFWEHYEPALESGATITTTSRSAARDGDGNRPRGAAGRSPWATSRARGCPRR